MMLQLYGGEEFWIVMIEEVMIKDALMNISIPLNQIGFRNEF